MLKLPQDALDELYSGYVEFSVKCTVVLPIRAGKKGCDPFIK